MGVVRLQVVERSERGEKGKGAASPARRVVEHDKAAVGLWGFMDRSSDCPVVFRQLTCAPDCSLQEGVRPLARCGIGGLETVDLPQVVYAAQRKLKQIQYRLDAVGGFLAGGGLAEINGRHREFRFSSLAG